MKKIGIVVEADLLEIGSLERYALIDDQVFNVAKRPINIKAAFALKILSKELQVEAPRGVLRFKFNDEYRHFHLLTLTGEPLLDCNGITKLLFTKAKAESMAQSLGLVAEFVQEDGDADNN